MLNNAFLQSKAVMHGSCNGLSMTWVKDHGCWSATWESCEHWGLAYV